MKQNSQTARSRKFGRIGAAVASAGLLASLSACGFNAGTLQPYDPSDGVNINVGEGPDGQPNASTIKVRGLMILAKTPTSGFLSASLDAQQNDSLTSVTGNVLRPDGSPGGQLTAKLSGPVNVGGAPVILVDHAPITITSNPLPAGQNARLTLTFDRAGSQAVTVPIMDGNSPDYATVQPSPSPTPTS